MRGLRSFALLLAIALAGCSPSDVRPAASTSPKPITKAIPSGPTYWLGGGGTTVEDVDGRARVIVGGVRVEATDGRITRFSDVGTIQNGLKVPDWVTGRVRYLFWDEAKVYGAASFFGALELIAELAGPVRRATPWLDGVAVSSGGGLFRVGASGEAVAPIEVGVASTAVAVSERIGAVTDVLGHTSVTVDAGVTYRTLPWAVAVTGMGEVRGALRLSIADRPAKYLSAAGVLVDQAPVDRAATEEAEVADGIWPAGEARPLELAVEDGLLLPDGGAFVVGSEHFGRVDLASGKATSVGELPEDANDCVPFSIRGVPMLVCEMPDRVEVRLVRGDASDPEISFEGPDNDLHKMVGAPGESLGYLGQCHGHPPVRTEAEPNSARLQLNPSSYRSRYLCVRAPDGRWREHRLRIEDAEDVVGWIPKGDGGAVALVARQGTLQVGEPRVSDEGRGLRVFRFARDEPPFSIPNYRDAGAELIAKYFRSLPDGSVEGWMPTGGGTAQWLSFRIDRDGQAFANPFPDGMNALQVSGRWAMGATQDNRFYQSVDTGRSWQAIEDLPIRPEGYGIATCSELGCAMSGVLRLGWSPRGPQVAVGADERSNKRRRTSPPVAPIAIVQCEISGRPSSVDSRAEDHFGLGGQSVSRRDAIARIGSLGWAWMPRFGGGILPDGAAVGGFVMPFDTESEIVRAVAPLSGIGLDHPPYHVPLGLVINADGGASPIVWAHPSRCPYELIARLGLKTAVPGCHEVGTLGVRFPDRTVLAGTTGSSMKIVAHRAGKIAEEYERAWPYTPERMVGVGSRDGRLVFVGFDRSGRASGAEFDEQLLAMGQAQRFAPVSELRLGGHPSCQGKRPDDVDVIVALKDEIDVVDGAGLSSSSEQGFARLRWSPTRVCLDAIDIEATQDRLTPGLHRYTTPGVTNRFIARAGAGGLSGSHLHIGPGVEVRQPYRCVEVAPP